MTRSLVPALAILLAGSSGCASPDCSETATCAADDGSTGDAPSDRASDQATDAGLDAQCDPDNPDCNDPACQAGYACIPQAPSGWLGPIALFDQGGGPPPPAPPSCAGAFGDNVFQDYSNPSYGPLGCSCTCGANDGACTVGMIGIFSDTACATLCSWLPASTGCALVNACQSGGGSAQVLGQPQPLGTWSCPPQVLTAAAAWGWERVGLGCGLTRPISQGGCSANQVCADKSPVGFQPTLCVYMNAALADCSSAGPDYPVFHEYYGTAQDGRSCALGSCGCTLSADAGCSLQGTGQWFTSGSPTCQTGGTTIDSSGACSMAASSSQVVWISSSMTTTVSGSCTSTGTATAMGSVNPDTSTAVTVCCAQ